MTKDLIRWPARLLRNAGNEILKWGSLKGVWIDVGAHRGETTLDYANHNPALTVYAFEPNLRAACSLMGQVPNFIVIPMAISEVDGTAQFHVNSHDAASSLLPMDESSRRSWKGGEVLKEESLVTVPTIRLDTFMDLMNIACVDFLKVDTQGNDLAVVRSAGKHLPKVRKITLEVDVSPRRLYQGSPSKEEVLSFMRSAGFTLVFSERQTYEQEENLTFVRSDLFQEKSAVLIPNQSPGPDPIHARLTRFLHKPWREKLSWAKMRTRTAVARIPVPVRMPSGGWFLARNDGIGSSLRKSDFENCERAFVERLLQPGMTVLDIGAHQGCYTLIASKRVGRRGTVIAFEPSPRERRALRLNLVLNRCTNVAVQATALGSEEAEGELYLVEGEETGCNSLRPPVLGAGTSRPISVPITRLDHWLAQRKIELVDFIKLDVEGAELSVLQGATLLLNRRPRPVILAEVANIRTAAWGYRAMEIVVALERMGFSWFEIVANGFLAPVTVINEREMNLVAVPTERIDQVLSGNHPC